MKIHCPSCDEMVPAADVVLSTMVALCRYCDDVFPFQVPGARGVPKEMTLVSPEVGRPDSLEMAREGKRLVFRRSWFQWALLFMTVWCIGWDAGMVALVASAGIWSIFVPHLWVGVAVTYAVLAGWLNTTTIALEDGELRVEHGPIPWPGGTVHNLRDIESVYAKGHLASGNPQGQGGFTVWGVLVDGTHRILVDKLDKEVEAFYLEQEIRSFLGLPDVPIRGELPRRRQPLLPAQPA